MEKRDKIIIVGLIVVIIAILIGFLFLMPNMEKQDTALTFKGNTTIDEGGSIKIKLTDDNKTALENQTVNITVEDKNNTKQQYSVVTDGKGIGKLKLNQDPGEYKVTITYSGNEKYNGCNASKDIKINEKVQEATVSSTSESSASSEPSTYASGLTDSEIDAYIQRDLDERAKNGVTSDYDYEGARQFYENVPPTGME